MKNNIQLLPVIASIGIGAAVYSMMTGRGGQLQNLIPLPSMMNQGAGNQQQQQGQQAQKGDQNQQGYQDQSQQMESNNQQYLQ